MITAVYSKTALTPAAVAEGLSEAQAKTALTGRPANWLNTLVNYIRETGVTGGLTTIRAANPTILNTGSDAGDAFLVRVAAIVEGGLVL